MLIYANRKRADELTAIADDRTHRQATRDKARAELRDMKAWDHVAGIVKSVQESFLIRSGLADALSTDDRKWDTAQAEQAMRRAAVTDAGCYVSRRYEARIAKAQTVPELTAALHGEKEAVTHELLRTMTGTTGPMDSTGIAQALHRLALQYAARYILACGDCLDGIASMRLPGDGTLEWAEYENALAQYPELAEVRDAP